MGLKLSSDWFEEREDLARKIELRNRPEEKKRKWHTIFCRKCQRKIEYSFKEDVQPVTIRCPDCGYENRILPLTEFFGSKEVID
jgi:RNase P subunit RPR2